jgi:hypothetical protein
MDSMARRTRVRRNDGGRSGGRPSRRRPLTLMAVSVLTLLVAALVPPTAGAAGQRPSPVPTGRAAKLSPRLQTLAAPQALGLSATAQAGAVGLPASGPGSLVQRDGGRLVVLVHFTDPSDTTLAAVQAAGLTNLAVSVPDAAADGQIAPADLPALVAVPGVAFVVEELAPTVNSPITQGVGVGVGGGAATNALCTLPRTGVVSEGDTQLKADLARTHYAVDGSGVTVGILSDSFNRLGGAAGDVLAKELPGALNPCGYLTPVQVQSEGLSGQDEGRAMAQIVHDLAPGATLAFASGANGVVDFANQIRALQTNGATVITDDITWPMEPMFQDGIIARAVDDVVALGATYYSSAGNNTLNVGGHDITSYEAGSYRPVACPSAVAASAGDSSCHNFDTLGGTDAGDTFTVGANRAISWNLSYNQPEGGVTTDLDLVVTDAITGAVVASSLFGNVTGIKLPWESVSVANASGSPRQYRLVVGRYTGLGGGDTNSPRFRLVSRPNGDPNALTSIQYNTSINGDIVGPTVYGHNGAARAATVAAVPYNDAAHLEYYSSHGPLKECWGPSTGTLTNTGYVGSPAPPITPCATRTVDFAATDGGANNFFGSNAGGGIFRFYGTSAAAPHAAAVSALAREHSPCATPDEVYAAQRSTATPLSGYSVDAQGSGLLNADLTLGALPACASTLFHPLAPVRVLDSRPTSQVGPFNTPWGGGTKRDIQIGNAAGVPANAAAVVLNVTVTDTTGNSFLSLWPAGTAQPTVSSLNWTPGVTIPNAVTVKLGSGFANLGKVSIYNLTGSVNVIVDVAGYYVDQATPGDGFTSQAPMRVLDSRPSSQVGLFSTPWGPGTQRDLQIGNAAGVPADADAVVLNVTVTDTTGNSFLTLFPTGATRPTASNLNWTPGRTTPNAVTVKLGTGGNAGKVSIYNLTGSVNVIADVAGYYKAGTGNAFHPLSPGRVLDSRASSQVGAFSTPWGPGTRRDVLIRALVGVPSGADSIVANTTVTDTTASSYLSMWPTGVVQPTASNLNWDPALTIPNAVTVKLGTGGKVSYYNLTGSVDVITDVAGWFG